VLSGLVASGRVELRNIDGWQKISQCSASAHHRRGMTRFAFTKPRRVGADNEAVP
jgi:hypothetical protein